MKRILFLVVFVVMTVVAFSQTESSQDKSNSKVVDFLEENGTFIKKQFYPFGQIQGLVNKVKFEVVIISDLTKTSNRIGCMRLITRHSAYANYVPSTEYIGTLDFDEIDASLQCLKFVKDSLLQTHPTQYTEVQYRSRDGVVIGFFYEEKESKWSAFIKTKSHISDSEEFVDSSVIDQLIAIMENCQRGIRDCLAN